MIEITQICDGCGRNRRLELKNYATNAELEQVAEQDGWRQVREQKHLCSVCIKEALNN